MTIRFLEKHIMPKIITILFIVLLLATLIPLGTLETKDVKVEVTKIAGERYFHVEHTSCVPKKGTVYASLEVRGVDTDYKVYYPSTRFTVQKGCIVYSKSIPDLYKVPKGDYKLVFHSAVDLGFLGERDATFETQEFTIQ